MNNLRRSTSGRLSIVSTLLACTILNAGCEQQKPSTGPNLAVTEVLRGGDHTGYSRADRVRKLSFPRDHGSHEGFKNEWWYFTGNLLTSDERHFGYQFTVFRNAVSPRPVAHASKWHTNQIYLAHFALTDSHNSHFYSDERFARGAVGLAGASHDPFTVWLEDWRAASATRCERCFDVSISAAAEDFSITLSLRDSKPMVLHGDAGLSRKSGTGNNASYYYSYPRLRTEGRINVEGVTFIVSGDSWFDHEWSTSSLEADQTGWDWFSMQLNDDTQLMLFQLRHTTDPMKNFLYGTYIDAQGASTPLAPQDFTLTPTASWRSPSSGATYPIAWRIQIPDKAFDLWVRAAVDDQEMTHSFRYWEGALMIEGTRAGRDLVGRGYLELTGYD